MKKVTKIAESTSAKVKLKKIKVAAYCRVSTDSDAQLESLEAQKTHYEMLTSRLVMTGVCRPLLRRRYHRHQEG